MTVGIIGNPSEKNLRAVVKEVYRLVEVRGNFLFNVACTSGSLGERVCEEVGAGKLIVKTNLDGLLDMVDYVIISAESEEEVRPLVNRVKRLGKHGSVVI